MGEGSGELAQQPDQERPRPSSPPPVAAVVTSQTSSYSHMGPLPMPEVLAGYEQVHAGLAERIVTMAEENHRHRIAMDQREADLRDRAVDAEISRGKRGQWMAFAVVVLVLAVAVVIVCATGDGRAAAGLVSAVVAALAAVFVLQWRSERREAEETEQQ